MTNIASEQLSAAGTTAGEQQNAPKKPKPAPQKPRAAAGKGKSGKKATPAKKPAKAPKKAKTKKGAARPGSKTATVLDLIARADGATLAEIMETTGWQAHSVRGFLSGTLGKKMRLMITSSKRQDGERVYSCEK